MTSRRTTRWKLKLEKQIACCKAQSGRLASKASRDSSADQGFTTSLQVISSVSHPPSPFPCPADQLHARTRYHPSRRASLPLGPYGPSLEPPPKTEPAARPPTGHPSPQSPSIPFNAIKLVANQYRLPARGAKRGRQARHPTQTRRGRARPSAATAGSPPKRLPALSHVVGTCRKTLANR